MTCRVPPRRVVVLLGTRPEVIKLAPIIRALAARPERFETTTVASGQQADLLYAALRVFGLDVDHDLGPVEADQSPAQVCARTLAGLDPILAAHPPAVVLVQGDTTTAMAGALAAFYRRIAVGHIEAGLRTGDLAGPFPEEGHRLCVSRLATWHFAPTESNRRNLLAEGVPDAAVFVTGNPVVDSLREAALRVQPSPALAALLAGTAGRRRLVLTMHRREAFGAAMRGHFRVVREFVDRDPTVAVIFPVHPNPRVVAAARETLSDHARIHMVPPLDYPDFIALLRAAWLVVSDSGGVEEEAPSLGRPLLVIRDKTERPELLGSGVAKQAVGGPSELAALLREAAHPDSWAERVRVISNPFGRGDSAVQIVDLLERLTGAAPEPMATSVVRAGSDP